MQQPTSFSGRAAPGAPRSALVAGVLVVVLAAAAALKPWDHPVAPSPSMVPPSVPASPDFGALAPLPNGGAGQLVPLGALAPFILPPPVTPGAAWSKLHWRSVDLREPLASVRRVVAWPQGYLAMGDAGDASTPLWSSADGETWDPIRVDTGTALMPGLHVLGAAPLGTDSLWVLAEPTIPVPPAVADVPTTQLTLWRSRDGKAWQPAAAAGLPRPVHLASRILLASTGSELVIGWTEIMAGGVGRVRCFQSRDGSVWHEVAKGQIPADFVLVDLAAAPGGGVLASGRIGSALLPGSRAAILRSGDGMHWSEVTLPRDPTLARGVDAAIVWTLLPAGDGVLAVGATDELILHEIWWHSTDGRRWSVVPDFGPVGAVPCPIGDEACALFPDGLLAADGVRLLAVGTRGLPTAWTSTDAVDWRAAGSAAPGGQTPGSVILLPAGALVWAGTGLWLGEASAAPPGTARVTLPTQPDAVPR